MKTLTILTSFLMAILVLQAQSVEAACSCTSNSDVCYMTLKELDPDVEAKHATKKINVCSMYNNSQAKFICPSGSTFDIYLSNVEDGIAETRSCDEEGIDKYVNQLNKDLEEQKENPTPTPDPSNPTPTPTTTPTPAPTSDVETIEGVCGKTTAAEAGFAGQVVNGSTVDGSWWIASCKHYNPVTKAFSCGAGESIEIMKGSSVLEIIDCGDPANAEAVSTIMSKLNALAGIASFDPYGDLRDFFVMKECKDETDPAMLATGRCYTDNVEEVSKYENLVTLLTVTLLGYKIPLVCENAAKQADLVAFQEASYTYLSAEQLAYNEYMLFLKEIKAFSAAAWGFTEGVIATYSSKRTDDISNPYYGYFLTETEEKVKASMTGTGDMCETVEVGDQLKAMLQLKMDYLAMADLVEKKIVNYNAISTAIYSAASVSHKMAADLDAAWNSCRSAASTTAAGCAAMVATGVALTSNPKTRPLGMVLIALGTYGLITVAGLAGAGDDLENALESAGGVLASKAAYPSVDSALKDVKKYGDRILACGSLKACSKASDKERATLVTCDPTKMTCAALGVGDELAPGEIEAYEESSVERFTRNMDAVHSKMKGFAQYIVKTFSPSEVAEILSMIEGEFLVNRVYAASRATIGKSATVANNNIVTAESKTFQQELITNIENLIKRMKALDAAYHAAVASAREDGTSVSAAQTKAYQTRQGFYKTLNAQLAELKGANKTIAQLQASIDVYQEIQEQVQSSSSLAGKTTNHGIAATYAENGSPIDCNYLPASKFSSCWKDASFNTRTEKRTTKSINLCNFYNAEKNRFDFCLSGQSTTKVVKFDMNNSLSYYKEIPVACYNVTNESNYQYGTDEKGQGTATLSDGTYPTQEQALHMEEMACVINSMNEELMKVNAEAEKTPAPEATKAGSASTAFGALGSQGKTSFNCEKDCGDATKGDNLKKAFGLWDDAVSLLRGDGEDTSVIHVAAIEADKAILSPRYRAVLFETIAKEVDTIGALLGGEGGMLAAIQSNITNVTRLLEETELKTVKVNSALCEVAVSGESVNTTKKETSTKGTTSIVNQNNLNNACPSGTSANGVCSPTATNLVNTTLRNQTTGNMSVSAGPKLSGSVTSSINSRVSLTSQAGSIFSSKKYKGSDAWSAMRKTAAQLSNARNDLNKMKAFRNAQDKANGVVPTNYDKYVAKASEKMTDIFSAASKAKEARGGSSGDKNYVVPNASSKSLKNGNAGFNFDAAESFMDGFEVPDAKTPSLVPLAKAKKDEKVAAAPAKTMNYDYAKYGRKEEDQTFESKTHGSRSNLFEVISKRYIKTGLKRLDYSER